MPKKGKQKQQDQKQDQKQDQIRVYTRSQKNQKNSPQQKSKQMIDVKLQKKEEPQKQKKIKLIENETLFNLNKPLQMNEILNFLYDNANGNEDFQPSFIQQKLQSQDKIYQDLKSENDCVVLETIQKLASELIEREDDVGLNIEILVQLLIKCLQKENNEIMEYASICINQLLDLQQNTILSIQRNNGIQVLCSKMKNVENQELQINCIKCLEVMSQKFSDSFYNNNFVSDLFDIYDFNVNRIQKSIINIFQNIVKNVQNELFLKDEIIPVLKKFKKININQNQSENLLIKIYAKISDKVIKICNNNYEKKQQYFKDIFDKQSIEDIFHTLKQILNGNNILQFLNTLENGIKILSQLSYYNTFQCKIAFDNGFEYLYLEMIYIIEQIMLKAENINSQKDYSQILSDIVLLINQITNLRDSPPKIIQNLVKQAGMKFTNANEKIKMFSENQNYLEQTLKLIFTYLPDIFFNISSKMTKYIVLFIFQKLINFADAKDLEPFFKDRKILEFFTRLSVSNDMLVVTNFLLIIQTLFQKIPSIINLVRRDGILENIKIIAENDIYLDSLTLNPIINKNIKFLSMDSSSNEINLLQQKLQKAKKTCEITKIEDLQSTKIEIKKLAQQIFEIIPNQQNQIQISDQLQEISNQMLNCQDDGFMILQSLSEFMIKNGQLTYLEVSQSRFFESFNLFITQQNRIQSFFQIFKQQYNSDNLMNYFIQNIHSIMQQDQQIAKLQEIQQEENLIQELRILSQKSKFQLKYIQNNISNQLSGSALEHYKQKDKFFSQQKNIWINLENYETFEGVEDYLLNKIQINQFFQNKLFFNQFEYLDKFQNSEAFQLKFTNENLEKQQEQKIENEDYSESSINGDSYSENYSQDSMKIKSSDQSEKNIDIKKNLKINFFQNKKIIHHKQSLYELLSQNLFPIEFELEQKQPQIEIEQNRIQIDQNQQQEFINNQINNINSQQLNSQLVDILKTLNIIYYGNIIQPLFINNQQELNLKCNKISRLIQRLFQKPLFILNSSKNEIHKQIVQTAPFIFNTSSKLTFYKANNFQIKRILNQLIIDNKLKLQEHQDLEFLSISKLSRKKFNISRQRVLQSSINNLDYFTSQNSIIEFDFQNEEGSGQGPTLEYYSLIAQEINQSQIWRKTTDNSLFPAFKDNQTKLFELMGLLIARAILDGRIIQLNLNPIFWKNIMGLSIFDNDLSQVDIELAKQIKSLNVDNVESMYIFFVIPGSDYELKENGLNIQVQRHNLDEYLNLLYQHYLIDSIQSQVEAFLIGFNKILDIKVISQYFNQYEINKIFSGNPHNNQWELQDLIENIIPCYGYTQKSQTFIDFLQIMIDFDQKQRQQFLKFVTGCPTLPYGGFKELNPKITVVKKPPYNQILPDLILPSVMTCQNYIKLPEYSSSEILRKKILLSIEEGQENFTLS